MFTGHSSLHYYLLSGAVSFDAFRVMDYRRASWRGRPVTARALGTSHAFSVEFEGVCLTELLSCAPGMMPGEVLAFMLLCGPFSVSLRVGSLAYRFDLTSFSLDSGDQLKGSYDSECYLELDYPGAPGCASPVTRIGWCPGPDRLEVETIHTYPEEDLGLLSRSMFEHL